MKMRKAERQALLVRLAIHTVCSWCGRIIQEGNRSQPWAHGVCERCLPVMKEES